jgi:ATP-dependent phosphofructokinase / diphosphate-dependent phosphofructokinase
MTIGVLTGGGDTQALNATLAGVIEQANYANEPVIGFRHGWQGLLDNEYIPLLNVNPNIGGTILKTSRKKLKGDEITKAANNLSNVVNRFIAIGGDDTLTVGREISRKLGMPTCFITKTIDNDVGTNMPLDEIDFTKIINYFTPGFPSAASLVAKFASDLRTTAYSHDRIIFLEAMGRKPGWLSLASYKGEPDFILIPEVKLDYETFLDALKKTYRDNKNAIVVVAEGLKYEGQDNPICEDETQVDSFGHKKLGGVAEILAARVKADLGIESCVSNNPNYLYRSGSPNKIDLEYGKKLGKSAVLSLFSSDRPSVAVTQLNDGVLCSSIVNLDTVLITDNNGVIVPRTVDLRFYDKDKYMITDLGREYFKRIN